MAPRNNRVPRSLLPKSPIVSLFMSLIYLGLENFGKYYSLYRGIVADNEDPENLHRLKLVIPTVSGNNVYEYWAFPRNVPSDDNFGSQMIPKKGAMVWVEFEGGDAAVPVWSWGHFARKEIPSDDEDLKDRNCYWFITPQGHRIKINDTKKFINIKSSWGDQVELNDYGISLITGDKKKISLGRKNGSDEPAVLADTAESLLIEFMNDLGNLTAIRTSTGITDKINTSPGWQLLVQKWTNKWKDFKSKTVNLNK